MEFQLYRQRCSVPSLVWNIEYLVIRGYTAPRTNLIPELQQRYQPIENLMLWQRLVTKGKQKLGSSNVLITFIFVDILQGKSLI